MKKRLIFSVFCLLPAVAVGCVRDLDPNLEAQTNAILPEGAGGASSSPIEVGEEGFSVPSRSGNFVHELADDGSVITTVVDATNHDVFQFLDLDTGEANEDGWDLKFRRFFILTNGGVTGDGGVQVAKLDGVSFEDLDEAPEDGWTIDQSDGEEDTDSEPDNVFNNGTDEWYDYEVSSHTLTSKDVTYVISSDEEKFYKFRVLDYYNEAGTPAVVQFQWAPLPGEEIDAQDLPDDPIASGGMDRPGQAPNDAITIDASERDEWVYFSVATGEIEIDEPEASHDWDLAFRRLEVRTNSGSSGPGRGGAKLASLAFDDIEQTTNCGFATDVEVASPIPGADATSSNEFLSEWFSLADGTSEVSVNEQSFILRTADGTFVKLRIWTWLDGVFQVSVEPISVIYAPIRLELEVPQIEPAYVSFSRCATVEVSAPEFDLGWDLAIAGTHFQTNSGTSGGGGAGAMKIDVASLLAPLELVDGTFIPDSLSQEVSGNPVLNAWVEEVGPPLTPKQEAYWIQTATGDYGLVEILGYENEIITLNIAYAGPQSIVWGEANP